MSQLRLTYLFKVYFDKTATSKERDELMELLLHGENDEQAKIFLTETWQQFNNKTKLFNKNVGDEMLANILQKEKVDNTVSFVTTYKSSFTWLRAAAAIFFIIATGFYFWLKSNQTLQPIIHSNFFNKDVKPLIVAGGNKAVLTLSDGSNIILDSTRQGTLTSQGNAKVTRMDVATLVYKTGDDNNQKVIYNTLSTPSGGQYQLVLPDGSKVWLNASSSIHFPTIFKGKERSVTVTGEAYFEVAKNNNMPFKITVRDMEVEVVGTHFNIMAYTDENSINTTLLEGSVKISNGGLNKILIPGQQSVVNAIGQINIRAADIEEVMAWKNGWFQFNASDIKTVMRQISRWYDVEVVYEGKVPVGHYTGSVNRNNDIESVLKIMESAGVRFKIEGKKITVLS